MPIKVHDLWKGFLSFYSLNHLVTPQTQHLLGPIIMLTHHMKFTSPTWNNGLSTGLYKSIFIGLLNKMFWLHESHLFTGVKFSTPVSKYIWILTISKIRPFINTHRPKCVAIDIWGCLKDIPGAFLQKLKSCAVSLKDRSVNHHHQVIRLVWFTHTHNHS